MIFLQFLIGLLTYVFMAYISYHPTFKFSNWFFPTGIVLAIVANCTWLWISRQETNSSALLIKGLWWDAMLVGVYLILPMLFFSAKLTITQSFGLGLIVLGLIFTKI